MEVTNHLSHVVILLCICMVLKLMEKCKKHNSNFFYWACGKLCIIPMSSIFVHTPGHYYGDASSIFMVILLLTSFFNRTNRNGTIFWNFVSLCDAHTCVDLLVRRNMDIFKRLGPWWHSQLYYDDSLSSSCKVEHQQRHNVEKKESSKRLCHFCLYGWRKMCRRRITMKILDAS